MSQELEKFIVANPGRIGCSVRTLRPYFIEEGTLQPWVHVSELCNALQYLAGKVGFQTVELTAMQEQHEELLSLLREGSVTPDHLPEQAEPTNAA